MASDEGSGYALPGILEKILATLAGDYGHQNNRVLQQLLVNSRYYVEENTAYDNWNGGQTGHAVHLLVPAVIFHEISSTLQEVGQELTQQLNRLSTCRGEYISEVLFELEDDDLANWRENSGALLRDGTLPRVSTDDELRRIWQPGYLRVFLSHKAEYKKEASELKDALLGYGVTSFVAHEDIEPTEKWESEIERALSSMEAMVALLTEGFSDSRWTDQEVGIAIGRGVPVIPVKLGIDPYGFIGKVQALAGQGKQPKALAKEIHGLLFSKFPEIKDRVSDALVTRLEGASSFNEANDLMVSIDRLQSASPALIERLEHAPQHNSQVQGANAVKSRLPGLLRRLRKQET